MVGSKHILLKCFFWISCMKVLVNAAADSVLSPQKMGTKILLTTEGRSGSTFVGQVLNLHPNVMYLYEPCRALKHRGVPEAFDTWGSVDKCTKLTRAIFDCTLTSSDLSMLMKDLTAVSKSRVLKQIKTFENEGEKVMHEEMVKTCKASIRIVKEIRFSRGVPDNLMYSEVKVLHLVRDPRAVLYSRLSLEAFCGGKGATRECVQPLCQGYRATLRGITAYLTTLEGRPFWQFYKFKRIKFEEVAAEPLNWTQRIYTWASLGPVSLAIEKWVKENTEAKKADGPYSTKRDSQEVINKWRGNEKEKGLTPLQVLEINQECGDILHQLVYANASELLPAWQTSPGSAIGGRVVPRQDASFMTAYPKEVMHQYWNAFCGKLSGTLTAYTGRGGHSDDCQVLGAMSIEECKAALEKSTSCSALSHYNGKCFLHDRTAADYVSQLQSHSKHVVKMLSGVDECLVFDAPLHHARRFYFGAQLGMSVPWQQKFYMYDAPAFNYSALIKCYVDEYGIEPWFDERRHEMAQNTASIWLHEALRVHPLRTLDPQEADLFVMPIEAYVSASLTKPCATPVPTPAGGRLVDDGIGGKVLVTDSLTTSEQRSADILAFLQESPFWKWGKWLTGQSTLWKMLRPAAILATIDEFFARDWNKVLVVPYVAHAMMTRWRKEPLPPTMELASTSSKPEDAEEEINRNVTFFFRGGILHGVDCKRKGTWVRRAAFEAFSEIPQSRITATEDLTKFSDEQTGLIDPSITERQRRQARVPNYSSHQYIRELRESQYCLHLRGDTSTSRRIYDALAAGCVPVIISDDSHLPFKSQIDWDSFTVSISEDELIEHKARVPQAIIEDVELLKRKQKALRKAQEDLLYGYGSPFDPPNQKFKSNVVSHLLQEAFELVPVMGKFRKFPDTFSGCTLVQKLWPD